MNPFLLFAGVLVFLIILFSVAIVLFSGNKSSDRSSENESTKTVVKEENDKSGKVKILSKRYLKSNILWIVGILVAIFFIIGFGQEIGMIHKNLPSCDPDNIGIDRSLIFVEGEDGDWDKLNSSEKDKYFVLSVPEEDKLEFYGRSTGLIVPVNLGIYEVSSNRNGFFVEGLCTRGATSIRILLEPTRDLYTPRYNGVDLTYALHGEQKIEAQFVEGKATVRFSDDIGTYLHPPVDVKKETFNVTTDIKASPGQTVTMIGLKARY